MATTESKNPSGKILLKDYFHETSSGHVEVSETQTLEVKGDQIILEETYKKTNFYKISSGEDYEGKFSISTSKLLTFIRENGTRI